MHDNPNWKGIDKLPEYNPFMFEVARHVRGKDISYVSEAIRIPVSQIKKIENGHIAPTKTQVEILSNWYNFPISFFQQWWDTKIDFTGPVGRNIPIDYMKYKVFRDLNPNFTRMQAHLPVPQAKIVSFNQSK